MVTEAGLKDVARHIFDNIRNNELANRLLDKVRRYQQTKNEQDDLTLQESRAIYRDEDYGTTAPLSKKRDLDVGWSDHAEYRSDLRDVEHEEVNKAVADWLRQRLVTKGPDSKKVRMKLPGTGTAVVDYDLTKNPADADVVTVWASKVAGGVMTEDQYLSIHGVDPFPPGEPGLQRTPYRIPMSQQRQNDRMMRERHREWQEKVDKLREEYRQKVMDGEIRPPSRVEKLMQRAKGHPDNDSVQAARRILRTMELWDDEMDRETDRAYTAGTKKRASLDLDYASMAEIKALGKLFGNEKLSAHDAAYATYCLNAIPTDWEKVVEPLKANALGTYRQALLGWFSYALLDRANMVHVTGLNKGLSAFVRDIPKAVLGDGRPEVPAFHGSWGFLNADRLEAAGRKVASVVKEDSIEAGLWKTEDAGPRPPLYWDAHTKVWWTPFSEWTYQNKQLLRRMGFGVEERTWVVSDLSPQEKALFNLGGKANKIPVGPPSLQELDQWYYKTWLPKNINRFKNLFESYIREAGSTITFQFTVTRSGKVDVTVARGISRVSGAIEELRLRYMGRQGREPWLEVMDNFIKLKTTRGPGAIHIIDRMNNLEHSNGMFMEKFPSDVQSWYLKFLNAKFSAPRVPDLARYIHDSDSREFIVFVSDESFAVRNEVDYRYVEKEGPPPEERGVDWLSKGYPYSPGFKKPGRDDPEVQKDLDELRFYESSTRRASSPSTFSGLVAQMEARVRLSAGKGPLFKQRMPTDRNLGTRVHRDEKKFHRTKRQKEKQRLRQEY